MRLTRIKIFLLVSLLIASGTSCQEGFLDQVPDDRLSEDDIFLNLNNTESFLASVYSNIPDEGQQRFVTTRNSGPWTGGSSEAEYAPWSGVPNAINIGNWNAASDWVGTFYARYYQGIRNATYFMQNANAERCTDCSAPVIAREKAEARGLRALFYYYLLRMFGPVVLMGDEVLPADVTLADQQMPRSSFDECVNYVVGEFDAAAAELPSSPVGGRYGRMTRSIMLAYKQELLTLAASPLFNGNTDYAPMVNVDDGKQLISQTYDESKWQRAADAAKAYLDEFVPTYHEMFRKNTPTGTYSAFLSCRDVLLQSWNKEWIHGRTDAGVTSLQYEVTPYHAGAQQESRGGGGLGATQEAVDSYFMANGTSPILGYNADGSPIVNAASGYQTTGFSMFQAPDDTQLRDTYNQWVNREPRFYVGITYNGRLWLNPNTPNLVTYTYNTGNSGASQSQWDYSPTGYNSRKNMHLGDRGVGGRAFCLYRLAMVYLNYIEALNEYSPGHPDILAYLNIIRERAGIPGYGETGDLPVPASKEAMREAIHKERMVEFAFENARWFDVRRWKIAEQTENGPIHGLDIHVDPPAFYDRVAIENRVFDKKHYLFPLPQNEVLINLKLVQNTGWSDR